MERDIIIVFIIKCSTVPSSSYTQLTVKRRRRSLELTVSSIIQTASGHCKVHRNNNKNFHSKMDHHRRAEFLPRIHTTLVPSRFVHHWLFMNCCPRWLLEMQEYSTPNISGWCGGVVFEFRSKKVSAKSNRNFGLGARRGRTELLFDFSEHSLTVKQWRLPTKESKWQWW